MGQASISHLPVGNGDCSLTRLRDDTTLVLDINLCQDATDPECKDRYDIHDHLKREAKKDAKGRLYHDVFGLTHPDLDHCRGFDEVFYTGDPSSYDAKKHAVKIMAQELWFSPRIFSKYEKHSELSDDAKAFKKEADRRIQLHKRKAASRDEPGNRVRIIGNTDDAYFDDLKEITTGAGKTLNTINGQAKDHYEIFVHGPFSADTDSEDATRNGTSIVFQARFTEGSTRVLAFFFGDTDCTAMEKIRDRSDDEDLEYDLLMASHHSSWTFFSTESTEKGEASKKVLEFLDKKRDGAWVISSSRTQAAAKKDVLPPHERAVKEYKKKVGDDHFLVTQEHPNEREPKPIIFDITSRGVKQRTRQESSVSVVVSRESPRLG